MQTWVLFSMFSLTCWGVASFVRKQATEFASPWVIVVIQSTTVFLLATIAIAIRGGPAVTVEALALAVAGGSSQFLANISLAFSLARGPASLVVPVSSMYPVVTLVLSLLLLGETISPTQALGLLLSLGALIAFSRGRHPRRYWRFTPGSRRTTTSTAGTGARTQRPTRSAWARFSCSTRSGITSKRRS